MNKTGLANELVVHHNVSKTEATQIVDTILRAIINALVRGESVSLVGFGSLVTSMRNARSGRNPQTGETIQIAASRVVKFRPGKELREKVSKES